MDERRLATQAAKKLARAEEEQRAAEALSHEGGDASARPSATTATAPPQACLSPTPLRDSTTPVISFSSGKIWGGGTVNGFKVRDESEVEALLAGCTTTTTTLTANTRPITETTAAATTGQTIARGNGVTVTNGNNAGSGEEEKERLGEQPIKSFTFTQSQHPGKLPSELGAENASTATGGAGGKNDAPSKAEAKSVLTTAGSLPAPRIYLRKSTSAQTYQGSNANSFQSHER
jgi:hypothetical protein